MPSYPQRVFVDANVWISWGPGFKKAEAATLEQLVEDGLVKIISTDLTIMEIAKRFRNSDVERLEALTKSDLRQAAQQLLNVELPQIDKEEIRSSFFERHLGDVKQQLAERMSVEERSIDSVKPIDILSSYTHGTGLFGPSGKKDQFPDAFIFATISSDVSEEKPLIVWSQDGDFALACDRTDHITRVRSMPQLLDALGIIPEGEQMIEMLEQRSDLFLPALQDALLGESVQAQDEDEAEVEVIHILEVGELTVSSLYRVSGGTDQFIGFGRCAPKANVSFTAPDWDSAIWDSEEKVSIPLHSVEGEAEVEIEEFAFSFLAEIRDNEVVVIDALELKEPWRLSTYLRTEDEYH
ncbi:PIN domain-containing protein [uncultured Xanthomonas sp.]|uniref:PIN domain-containing protein n=1 Tax=uncultured Xanthomonas sp. TaxID=152831 RepID=UPI0025EB8B9E|nr:PIN domain-containing protein [uncultured Xanthomonas sp.]